MLPKNITLDQICYVFFSYHVFIELYLRHVNTCSWQNVKDINFQVFLKIFNCWCLFSLFTFIFLPCNISKKVFITAIYYTRLFGNFQKFTRGIFPRQEGIKVSDFERIIYLTSELRVQGNINVTHTRIYFQITGQKRS